MKFLKCLSNALLMFMSVTFIISDSAFADAEFKELANVLDKSSLGIEVHLLYRADNNPYFGAKVGETDKENTNFGEILGKIRFTAEKKLSWTTLEAQAAPYYVSTTDQDVYGLHKDKSELKMDQAWIKFHKLFNSPFDLTIGRQDIQIEKWFVIADGELQPAAGWLAFHYSFPFGVRVDGDFGAFKTNVFWARSNDYYQKWDEGVKDDVEVAGINLHFDISENAFLYGGYFRKIDESKLLIPKYTPEGRDLLAENQTSALDIGFDVKFGALQLEGELVYETGDAGELAGKETDRKATGGFASATFTFPVAYSPFIRGTYLYFSGDDDPEDDEIKDYDPMFSSFIGWNRWIAGELTGEAHLPNSNKKVIIAEAGFSPKETMTITAMYLSHKLDEQHWLNVPTSSTDWSDEFNLFMDYQVSENLFFHLGLGYVKPDNAAEEIFGHDDNACFGQVWLTFAY